MFDPKKLLDDLLGSNVPGMQGTMRDKAGQVTQMAKDNPLAAGAIVAVLLGTGTGRAVAGSALKMGGLAAIGGLAYKAYQNYEAGKQAETLPQGQAQPELLPPPAQSGFDPEHAPQGQAEFALMLVRAMIAAAKADGHIDDAERAKIADRLAVAGIGAEAERFLMAELDAPLDFDALAASAQSDEQRLEIYTASRLAIDPDTRAERGYLDMLAGRLNLPDALIDHVEATVVSAKSGPPPAAPVTPVNMGETPPPPRSPW